MVRKLIGRTGAAAGCDFVLDESLAVTRLGAAPSNEICVQGKGVSREHAVIVRRGTVYFVEDAGSTNGTFVNGQRVKTERLRHLDVLTVGRNVDLIYVERAGEQGRAAAPAVIVATLEFLDGPAAGTSVDIPPGETKLGRAATCQVLFEHRSVGKQHARIVRTDAQLTIEDLESANGTFVNGKRVRTQILANGDKVTLAGVRTLRVSLSADFKAAAAVAAANTQVAPAFDQNWRTKLIWSPQELAIIAASREAIMPPATPARPRPAVVPIAGRVTSPARPADGGKRPEDTPTIVKAPIDRRAPIRGVEINNADRIVQRLGLGSFIIGRSAEAIVRLDPNDRGASRTHAMLFITPDGIDIDNRSQNGTFVNKQQIAARQALQDGDEIRCGSMTLTVRFLR